jgi:hypothetical protein
MESVNDKELVTRFSQHLLQHGFKEYPDSPYAMLLYRDTSEFPDVKHTYFIFTKFDEGVSVEDMRTHTKTAQDYLASVFKLKGFLKSITETYVLYFIGLMDRVPQYSINLLSKQTFPTLQRFIPVWIDLSTNQWFISQEAYVNLPYDIYKFHVQEIVDRLGSVLYPDFLKLPKVQQALFDISLASDEERKEIVKTKYKESRAELFSICNIQLIRGENINPTFDIRHALAINYLTQALIDEISLVRGESAFEIGYASGSKETLYNKLQDQRIEWLKAGEIKALAYCPICKQMVEPITVKQGVFDSNQRVGCPNSDKHKKLLDLVFFMPDEMDEFTRALMNRHP